MAGRRDGGGRHRPLTHAHPPSPVVRRMAENPQHTPPPGRHETSLWPSALPDFLGPSGGLTRPQGGGGGVGRSAITRIRFRCLRPGGPPKAGSTRRRRQPRPTPPLPRHSPPTPRPRHPVAGARNGTIGGGLPRGRPPRPPAGPPLAACTTTVWGAQAARGERGGRAGRWLPLEGEKILCPVPGRPRGAPCPHTATPRPGVPNWRAIGRSGAQAQRGGGQGCDHVIQPNRLSQMFDYMFK